MQVTYQVSLSIDNAGAAIAGATTVEKDLDGDGLKAFNTQLLSTTAADVNIGTLTWSNATLIVVQNYDTTNSVILVKSAVEFAEIPPGGIVGIHVKADGTAIQAKSSAGTPRIGVTAAGPFAA